MRVWAVEESAKPRGILPEEMSDLTDESEAFTSASVENRPPWQLEQLEAKNPDPYDDQVSVQVPLPAPAPVRGTVDVSSTPPHDERKARHTSSDNLIGANWTRPTAERSPRKDNRGADERREQDWGAGGEGPRRREEAPASA